MPTLYELNKEAIDKEDAKWFDENGHYRSIWYSYYMDMIEPYLIMIWEGIKSLLFLPISIIFMPIAVIYRWYYWKKKKEKA